MGKIILFDFDGVINSYITGWDGVDTIADPPVDGIQKVLNELHEKGYKIIIYSSRCSEEKGRQAIKGYCEDYGIYYDDIAGKKPPAFLTIDDRCICFDGNSDSLIEKIEKFIPWFEKQYIENNENINNRDLEVENLRKQLNEANKINKELSEKLAFNNRKINDISDLSENLEGQLLLAAICILTTSDKFTFNGEVVNGCKMQPFEIINILKKVASEFVKSDCKNSMLKDIDKYASEYEDKILFGVKAGDGSLDKSLFEYIYNQINNKNEVQDKLYNPKFATKIPSKLDRFKIEIDILRDNNTKLKEENKYFEVINKRLKKQLEMIIFITTGQLE